MKYELEAKAVYEQIQNYMCETPAWTFIAEALAEAEKKGREEGSLSHTMTYHQGKKEGWNEAITAAKKVAEDDDNIVTCDGANSYYCQLGDASATSTKIASKIEALRKG